MANYNLSAAITELNLDQVRTQTMYEVQFVSGFDAIDKTLRRMQVYGQNFSLPDRTVNFEDVQYRAYKIPVPTTIDMGQDHSVTVYADVRGDLRRALLDWQAACIDPDITHGSFFESNRRPTRLGPGGEQEPSITINLLAPNYQDIVEQTKIYGARVQKVGGLELSNLQGSVSTFTVDFKSVYWEQKPGATIGKYDYDLRRFTENGNPHEDGEGHRATEDNIPGSYAVNLTGPTANALTAQGGRIIQR